MPTSYIDSNIDHYEPIYTPKDLRTRFPASEAVIREVITVREEIRRILSGESRKVMLIVGPCSIHKPDEALEYAEKLHALARRVEEKFLIILRTYFEKSRTGLGWKGLIDEPDLDGKSNVAKGLQVARKLLLDINTMGMPCATELVDPITPQYILDLIVWSAIGARSVESRRSRELASGISTPVGFKNRTDGNIDVAIEALNYAKEAHSFSGITENGTVAEIKTKGNQSGHIILRGGSNGPNYDAQHVAAVQERLRRRGLPEYLMIDCSHANSNKDHTKQPGIFLDIIDQIHGGNEKIFGIMVESYLNEGKQPYGQSNLKPGVSITDACLNFEDTESIILEAHDRLTRP
ncbi:MAG: 3-deoxy-7-phosphoheptulonate synthase [Bacteroidota bacterium]